MVMKFRDVPWDACLGRSQQHAAVCQPGDVLKNVRMLNGLGRVLAPRERGVTSHEHAGDGSWIEVSGTKTPDNDRSGIPDVA